MKKAILAFVGGAILGGAAVGVYSDQVKDRVFADKERELAGVWFICELANIEAASRSLGLLDEKRFDTVRRIALMNLESSIDTSYRLTVSARPIIPAIVWPNLKPGIERAEAYFAANDSESHLVGWLHDVKKYTVIAAGN